MSLLTITDEAQLHLADVLTKMVQQASPDVRSLYEIADWYQRSLDRNTRKDDGIFYTPPELAERLAASAMEACRVPVTAVLDPACGGGSLLLASAAALAAKNCETLESVVNNRIFGMDRDPLAVHLCRLCLKKLAGLPLELPSTIDSQVITGDALAPEQGWESLLHRWGNPEGFPIVIINPPWGSFSGRHRVRRVSPGASTAGWQSLHGMFMEMCLVLACDGGVIAAVAPTQVAELDGYRELRQTIAGRSSEIDVQHIGESAFCGVNQSVSFYYFRKCALGRGATGAAWTVNDTRTDTGLIAELDSLLKMPRSWFSDCGVHTGNAARRLILPLDSGEQFPLIRHGACVHPGWLDEPSFRLNLLLNKTDTIYFRYLPLQRYQQARILIRQTAHFPVACLHQQPTYFRNSVLACTPEMDVDANRIVRWLNSDYIRQYHIFKFHDARQRTFPQVKISHLASLPMPPDWFS